MDWKELFKMQEQLDTYILSNHQLEGQSFFEEKILALLVELGELANETRCFKYWSHKLASNKAVIIEEYVDNIHFLLSLGLEKGYDFKQLEVGTTDLTVTEQFNLVFSCAMTFYKTQLETDYQKVFKEFLQLASLLGFSESELITAYHEKNKVNYERQQTGY